MNILMLNYEFPPLGGGGGNANYYILHELAAYPEYSFHLITSSSGGYKQEQFSKNITIHYLDIGKKNKNFHSQSLFDLLKYSRKALKYAKKLLKEHSFVMTHAFFGIPCGYLALKLGLPYIVSLRGSDVPFHSKKYEFLDKLLFKNLSRKIWKRSFKVVANSEGLKQEALVTAPDEDIRVIYNGVDVEKFKPLSPGGTGTGKIRLISTGRLSAVKGYNYLIKALSEVEGFELILIGDGPQKENLESLADECRAHVTFTGRKNKDEVVRFLQEAHIYVLSSLNEGMSNSMLEAIACGLPVIATDVGGARELITDGENGFIIKKGSVESIKEALTAYRKNPALVESQGKKSREQALKMSWKQTADEYVSLYRKLLSQ